jgi:hypothetical protein
LLKAAPLQIFAVLATLSHWSLPAEAQQPHDFGGAQSLGITSSYSPDSSHILIGESQQRRTWTVGVEYTHILLRTRRVRWDYEASVLPFYQESDPTVVGIQYTIAGTTFTTPQTPTRVTTVNHGPIGYVTEPRGLSAPIYALFGRQSTNGGALAPLGARATLFQHRRIQPSFSLDLGFVVATRDLPIDNSDQFNYMFSFGPGIQVFANPLSSVRLEYIYRHISNAGQGNVNPGVDQGSFRLTLIRSR